MSNNGAIASDDKVPVRKAPSNDRIVALRRSFGEEFGSAVDFIVRVPGRVNLIGEHVDYCGYPVLPMALEQDVLMAAGRTREAQLAVRNVDRDYGHLDCPLTTHRDIEIRNAADGKPHWYNYVLCGIKGAMEYVDDKFEWGLRLYVDGNIPAASGLSSSSALVSSACLSFLHAQGIRMKKTSMASLCAQSERYIGTQGGGMDQAIAFLAKRGDAQYITWEPLVATPVPLPEEAVFVIAHSTARANKAATDHFNRRVVECRLAAAILAKCNNLAPTRKIMTLSEVQKASGKKLEELPSLVNEYIPLNVYSRREVCEALGVTDERLSAEYLSADTTHLTEFKLRQRATHVFEEAVRVERFRAICCDRTIQNGDAKNESVERSAVRKGERKLEAMGRLMRSSHASLEALYECSHPSLDRLVQISDEEGVAARLTGAGWGGCVVALCPTSRLHAYIDALKRKFYSHSDDVDRLVFATKPNEGAEIYSDIS